MFPLKLKPNWMILCHKILCLFHQLKNLLWMTHLNNMMIRQFLVKLASDFLILINQITQRTTPSVQMPCNKTSPLTFWTSKIWFERTTSHRVCITPQHYRNKTLKQEADRVRKAFSTSTVEIDWKFDKGVRAIKLDQNIVGKQLQNKSLSVWSGACAHFTNQ